MKERQYSLDVLKILATVCILFHHYQQYISGSFSSGINYYGGRYNFGFMVELFFVLSGYFMYPYIDKIRNGLSLKKYYLARLQRLLPMVAVTAIAYQFLVLIHMKNVGTAWFMHSPGLWDTLVAALGLQEGWVFTNNIYVNYPVWYVSVLLICYLLFYFVTFMSKKLNVSARYFYLALIFVGIAIDSYHWQLPFLSAYTARGYYAFFTGILLATYCFEKQTDTKSTIIALSVVVILIDLIAFHNGLVEYGLNYISTFLLFPSLILAFKSKVFGKIFSAKI